MFSISTPAQNIQQPPPAQKGTPPATGKTQSAPPVAGAAQKTAPPVDPEVELKAAIEAAGNDRAAFVHNLEDYLKRFPETPRKAEIYRALIDANLQLREPAKALDAAARAIQADPQIYWNSKVATLRWNVRLDTSRACMNESKRLPSRISLHGIPKRNFMRNSATPR
jgi:hypothetical protein